MVEDSLREVLPQVSYSQEKLTAGGVIDVKKAKRAGYVPYTETADDMHFGENRQAKAYIEAHYDELKERAERYIADFVGREVEVTGMFAIFPYMTASVNFKTTTVPVIHAETAIGLSDSVEFKAGEFKAMSERTWRMETIMGMYNYAYEPELNDMRAHFEATFPEYMPHIVPSADADARGDSYPWLEIVIKTEDADKEPASDARMKRIYDAYMSNPEMSREDMRRLFEDGERWLLSVNLSAIARDEAKLPTEEEALEIRTAIDNYDYYWTTNTGLRTGVFLGSNLRQPGEWKSLHDEILYF